MDQANSCAPSVHSLLCVWLVLLVSLTSTKSPRVIDTPADGSTIFALTCFLVAIIAMPFVRKLSNLSQHLSTLSSERVASANQLVIVYLRKWSIVSNFWLATESFLAVDIQPGKKISGRVSVVLTIGDSYSSQRFGQRAQRPDTKNFILYPFILLILVPKNDVLVRPGCYLSVIDTSIGLPLGWLFIICRTGWL